MFRITNSGRGSCALGWVALPMAVLSPAGSSPCCHSAAGVSLLPSPGQLSPAAGPLLPEVLPAALRAL